MANMNKGLFLQRKVSAGQGKGNVTISSDRDRSIYNRISEEAKKQNMITSPGFLRVEQRIVNGRTKYEFVLQRDTNSDSITEQKLDRNDKFVMSRLGIFLMRRSTLLYGNEVLQTYPNPIVFPTEVGNNFVTQHMEAFYNGKMSFTVGQTKWIEALDTRRFRHVPATQEALVTNTDGATVTIVSRNDNSESYENSGMIDLTPQITINGDAKTVVAIDVPIMADHKVKTGLQYHDDFIVLIGRGFLQTNK